MHRGVMLIACVLAGSAVFGLTAAAASAGKHSVRPAERRAINRTLDRFVPAALARKNPGAAYRLATPSLRAGSTRADWARGDLPAYPYKPRGRKFHAWTFAFRDGNLVGITLMLHPAKREPNGPIAFDIDLRRIDGRWLVDSVFPEAFFARAGDKPRVFAPVDTGPAPDAAVGAGKARLGAIWLVVPLGLLGLAIVVPLTFLLLKWRRDRKAVREYERAPRLRAG